MRKVTKSSKPSKSSTLGEKIKYIRTNQNITQDELAKLVFKTRQEINYFENDTRKPDIETLILIAKHLEVSLDYLCGLNDIEKPNSTLQNINNLIGLSEKSIYQLSKFKNCKEILSNIYEDYELAGIEKEEQKLEKINQLLENPKFEEILNFLIEYENIDKEIQHYPTEKTFQRNNLETLEDKKSLLEYKITKKIFEILNQKS